ncbi:MAG: asparagine synthetase B [Candidatus Latescibacteria bacterium]|nr:asparagine synthetase B [Candidatus Latescibacterota bacterium]NIM22604.1 asparagine synthetase B [Candidatus Latescibacterota bacterium]NIM64893.1 asparagine synthetase B [Candidatus Latescibacterota bacterium]NIO01408.1 asparagine synthetase B [Candidatus Latescibacterota bacterium]NIO27918.1 asparagine synthetase B [Candidatus Latescibacterota bacterium]
MLLCPAFSHAASILVPMDLAQTNHLKAYGLAYHALEKGHTIQWLLNYRGGSFLIPMDDGVLYEARLKNITVQDLSASEVALIYAEIEKENMETIVLEKAPRIAVYIPPVAQPWDDAVMLALTYAEIPFDRVFDEEVLAGVLDRYDWLHLHHEDFTGQYGKFYAAYRHAEWYKTQQVQFEALARKLGYDKVSEEKKAVAEKIRQYVLNGGFLFAMCSATDTIDIAFAANGIDIAPREFDHDGITPGFQDMLQYDRCLAFTNFRLISNPLVYEFSDIDTSDYVKARGSEADYFTLFSFSAKYDPVPTMLTQNHVNVVKGFLGQTTGYKKSLVKKSVVILGEDQAHSEVKYLHGNFGRGTFTFLGGHDPEDYQHAVGDPPTDLSLHVNSPGYRLILNNILFPAAKKKKMKT